MYILVSAPVIGSPQPDGWAQVVTNAQQNVVCAFSVSGVNAQDFGHEVATQLLSATPNSSLELHQFMEHLVSKATAQGCSLQLAAILLLNDKSVLIALNGKILLKRSHKLGQILNANDELQIVEGRYIRNDVYLLSTRETQSFQDQLHQAFLHQPDAESFTTQFMPTVQSLENSALVAISYVDLIERGDEIKKHTPKTSLAHTVKKFFFQQRDVYIRQSNTKHLSRIVIPLLLVVIGVSAIGFFWRGKQRTETMAAQAVIQPAEQKVEEIKKIINDNPIEARKETEDLLNQLDAAKVELKNQPTAQKLVQNEFNTVHDFYQSISGVQQIETLPKFFDLLLAQSGFLASKMDLSDHNLFFLDTGSKKVISLDIDTKQNLLLPTGTFAELKDFTVVGKVMYLLGGGLSKFDLTSTQPAVAARAVEDENKDAVSLRSYTKYIYALNPTKRNIFRYTLQDKDVLSSPSALIRPDQNIDYANVQSFAIDGDIWLGMKNGEIKRLVTGKAQTFQINGLKENLSSAPLLYTNENLDNLYILEPSKNRLLVISKKGDFLKEIKSDTLGTATAVVADEKTHRAFVLSGSLVFEIGL